MKFEAKYFDILYNTTLRVIKDYYYPYRFWINHNLKFNKTYNTRILKAIITNWNDE